MRTLVLGSVVVVSAVMACSHSRDFAKPSPGAAGSSGGEDSGAGGTDDGHAGAPDGDAGASLGDAGATGSADCGEGEFLAEGSCAPLTDCSAGTYVAEEPSATSDRVCEPCPRGSFSAELNAATCVTWSTCGTDESESEPPSATTDRVCVDEAGCSTAANRACTVDCPCASTEGVCTADDQCVSGTTCVAGSGKKVGRAGDTCLATHCNNDKQDATETSVDCGGECGCRATYEVVPLKGIPTGATWGQFATMSRDGKVLAGYIGRSRTSYPVVVAADGNVTELNTYSKGGGVAAASGDGSVLIGTMSCANPPTCTDTTYAVTKWVGTAAPVVVRYGASASDASTSGSVVVGSYYDMDANASQGFILNGTSWASIAELSSAQFVTPDGKFVVGALQAGVQYGLWEAQTNNLTKIGSASWENMTVAALNGTTPAVVGYGYLGNDQFTSFRWKGGVMTELGLLSGAQYTSPYDVSFDGGTVVGLSGTNELQQAFIWTDKDKLRSVVDELRARGLEPPLDLTLVSAQFISDDGKTIIGPLTEPPGCWRVTLD